MEVVDRYTLRFRSKETDYNFVFVAAHVSLGPWRASDRSVRRRHDGTSVGTGATMLKSWMRRSKIVLEANPEYRGFAWDFPLSDRSWDEALCATMKGTADAAGRAVEITIIEEAQSRWLAFQQQELDYIRCPRRLRRPPRRG